MPILYEPPKPHHHDLPDARDVRAGTIAFCEACKNYLRAENPEGFGNGWRWISERKAKRLIARAARIDPT